MTIIEDQLRSDLRRAAGTQADGIVVDPDRVLSIGRRTRRNRQWRGGFAVAALAVVAGLAAVGLQQRPMAATPAPLSAPSSPTAAPVNLSVDLREQFAQESPPFNYLELTATRHDGEVTFALSGSDAPGQGPELARMTVAEDTLTEQRPVSLGVDGRLFVTVLAAEPSWLRSTSPGGSSVTVAWESYGGTVLIEIGEQVSAPASLIWADADGVVRGLDGTVLPSVEVSSEATDGVVVIDEAGGLLDYEDRWQHSHATTELSQGVTKLEFHSRVDGQERATAVVLLPKGAKETRVVLDDAGIEWQSAVLPGTGRTAIVAAAAGTEDLGAVIKSVVYTDASGRQVTLQ